MTALPPGWSVELLGIANAVTFSHDSGQGLLWCDGRWSMTSASGWKVPAPGVPVAHSVKEARKAGTAFLVALPAS
jgi:hypothetical protein